MTEGMTSPPRPPGPVASGMTPSTSAPAPTPSPPAAKVQPPPTVTSPAPRPSGTTVGAAAAAPGRARRAKLVVRRIDPWSVLKFSLVFSVCLLIVFVVAVSALYVALDQLGVFDSLNEALIELTNEPRSGQGGVEVVFSPGRVIGGSIVVGLLNVVIFTALSTLGAFLYNLCGDIVGGIEVTLAERD